MVSVCSPEGTTVLPAQGNALGNERKNQKIMSAQRAKDSPLGTVGPLGRKKNPHGSLFPGRCPGLGEPEGLAAQEHTVFQS